MKTIGGSARIEGADDGPPIGAVGMYAPDAPRYPAADALRLQAAEYHATVTQYDWVQGTGHVEVA
ncbi:MAG: hypothetical protein CMI32_03015, partial [Opitutales bacterium]|nr:hypothetical protein [Opitutales bacterium]